MHASDIYIIFINHNFKTIIKSYRSSLRIFDNPVHMYKTNMLFWKLDYTN